jgi:hypothetical protein
MAKELRRHGAEAAIHSGYIADLESGRREPSLLTLSAYSRVTGISTDVLIDDGRQLP